MSLNLDATCLFNIGLITFIFNQKCWSQRDNYKRVANLILP